MNIQDVVAIARRVHDAESMNFGASSSREERNRNWARIIGIVHFGHPAYNPTPDPQWHIKDAGGGRPQSDDVAVSMPSRHFWDCIPGSGANGYRFQASGDHGPLSGEQHVYAPPRPDGAILEPGPSTPEPPAPPADPSIDLPKAILEVNEAFVIRTGDMYSAAEFEAIGNYAASLGWDRSLAIRRSVLDRVLAWIRTDARWGAPPTVTVDRAKILAVVAALRAEADRLTALVP